MATGDDIRAIQDTNPSATLHEPLSHFNDEEKGATKPETVSIHHNSSSSTHKSTGIILLYFAAIFVPLVCFSAVLLTLVFHYRVGTVQSSFSLSTFPSSKELPGGYYLVNFSATRLIFISSWSSSVAPTLAGLATALWLFPTTAILLKSSSEDHPAKLPTPYQFAMVLGLSSGSMSQIWKVVKYSFWKHKEKNVPMLNLMVIVVIIAQILSILTFVLDSILHFATETVPFTRSFPNSEQLSSFGQGLIAECYSSSIINADSSVPCTYNVAATGEGFYDASEVAATLNNVSTTHQLLATTYNLSSETDLLILGPALTDIPSNLEFQASTVGVATTCQPISKQCNLQAPYGASTPFYCNANFYGDLQIAEINTTATLWSEGTIGNFVFGAVFQDEDFTVPYTNYSLDYSRDSPSTNLLNPFYMGIAVRTAFGTNVTVLQNDPDITLPEHGGLAFILGCEVLAMNIVYTFFNGTVASYTSTPANGTIAWYFNGVMGAAGSVAHLSQGVDIAVASSNSKDLARAWARSYSQEALSILASVHSGIPNLAETVIETINVTKIPRAPLLALVVLNILFALFGLTLALCSLGIDSAEVTTVYQTMNVEGLAACAFENGELKNELKTGDLFQEKTVGGGKRVGLQSVRRNAWKLVCDR